MIPWRQMTGNILPKFADDESNPLEALGRYWASIPDVQNPAEGLLESYYDPQLDQVGRMAERCGTESWLPSTRDRYWKASAAMWGHWGVYAANFQWWCNPHQGFGNLRTIIREIPYWWVLPGVVLLCERPVKAEGDFTIFDRDRTWRVGYRDGFGVEFRKGKLQPWPWPKM